MLVSNQHVTIAINQTEEGMDEVFIGREKGFVEMKINKVGWFRVVDGQSLLLVLHETVYQLVFRLK